MRKIKLVLTSIFVGLFFISSVNAKVLYTDSEISSGNKFTKNPSGTVGFYVDSYSCYSCRESGFAPIEEQGGIGVFFKNEDEWQLGSFGNKDEDGLSALFTLFDAGHDPIYLESKSGRLDAKDEEANIHVYVTPEIYKEDSNFILLKYSVQNLDTDATEVKVATFNDIYLGPVQEDADGTEICNDNAAFTNIDKSIFKNINKGFVAKTGSDAGNKFMTVTLDAPGVLKKDTGEFGYWVGNHITEDYPRGEAKAANDFSSLSDSELPYAKAYTDAGFSYTWIGNVPGNSTVEFETLIGLGVAEPPTINIESLEPNYNTDTKEFNLTTDDKNVIISGTIKDKCGMGSCTYNINGEDIPCDQATYYTSGADYSTKYTATIPTEKLTDVNENTFSVTANSVACGTATDTTTFTLHKDRENNKQTGINNNYIALGIILLGGIGLFIYSRKQNKFPQA